MLSLVAKENHLKFIIFKVTNNSVKTVFCVLIKIVLIKKQFKSKFVNISHQALTLSKKTPLRIDLKVNGYNAVFFRNKVVFQICLFSRKLFKICGENTDTMSAFSFVLSKFRYVVH